MRDQLTPREREVAEFLRHGLTNEEIAAKLGITLDGAKYHVSQILSKLGVASREEAARTLSVPIIRPQRTRVDVALLLRFAAASLVAATVVGVALLSFGVLQTSGSADTSLTNPTGTLEPYVAPTTDVIQFDGNLPVLDAGSDKIEFPHHLSNFPGLRETIRAPSDVAVDRDGNLWITWVGTDGKAVLARNPSGTTTVSVYDVPILVRGIDTFVEIDAKGRPVVGSGGQLAVVDPKTLEYKKISLPVAQMLVLDVEGESAFVVPWETDGLAVTVARADLETGTVSEIDVPSSFGYVDDIEVTPDSIWLIKNADGPRAVRSHIGRLDRVSGDLQTAESKVHTAGVYENGVIALTWSDGLAFIDSNGAQQPYHTDSLDAALVDKGGPLSTVRADGRGGVWISDVTAQDIVWFNPKTGATEVYPLPRYELDNSNFSCPRLVECPAGPTEIWTQITATAVSPDGDLYFTDTTRNRIGRIRAP